MSSTTRFKTRRPGKPSCTVSWWPVKKDRYSKRPATSKTPSFVASAIHWLGVMDAEGELWDLYQQESSDEMKEKILHALFLGDGSERLLAVARDKSESEDVRLQAIHWLGVSDATDELWALYQDESSIEVKKRILHGLFLSDDTDKLAQIARNGSEDFELRKAAIHNLGLVGDAVPAHTSRDLQLRIGPGAQKAGPAFLVPRRSRYGAHRYRPARDRPCAQKDRGSLAESHRLESF